MAGVGWVEIRLVLSGQVPVVAVLAFVHAEPDGQVVVVLGHAGGGFGFSFGGIANFMLVANPATFGFVSLV